MARRKKRKTASWKTAGWGLVLAALASLGIGGFGISGCDSSQMEGLARGLINPSNATTPTTNTAAQAGEKIRIASFNIQVFGTSKLAKPDAMQVLGQVIRQFDVVAIQEIRATDQTVMDQFLQWINTDGAAYSYVIGPRLGRTSSKEQYAFLYNTATIEVQPNSVYTAADPYDLLHREPLVASFRVRGNTASQPFSFTLINIHTDPDETDQELDALDDVYLSVRQAGTEDDVILLGDLNVDERHLGQMGQIPGITYTIAGQPTNTRGTKTYDNLLFHGPSTTEYTGSSGVLNLMSVYNLTMEQVLQISDHLPVWSEFSATESTPGTVAARP